MITLTKFHSTPRFKVHHKKSREFHLHTNRNRKEEREFHEFVNSMWLNTGPLPLIFYELPQSEIVNPSQRLSTSPCRITDWAWTMKNFLFSHNFNLIERRFLKRTPVWHPWELHVHTLTRRMWVKHATSPVHGMFMGRSLRQKGKGWQIAYEMWWHMRRNQISSFGETDESI
jgi:hypothetical protein